jgi:hypothetical protein
MTRDEVQALADHENAKGRERVVYEVAGPEEDGRLELDAGTAVTRTSRCGTCSGRSYPTRWRPPGESRQL